MEAVTSYISSNTARLKRVISATKQLSATKAQFLLATQKHSAFSGLKKQFKVYQQLLEDQKRATALQTADNTVYQGLAEIALSCPTCEREFDSKSTAEIKLKLSSALALLKDSTTKLQLLNNEIPLKRKTVH
jgi:hypothetical protein